MKITRNILLLSIGFFLIFAGFAGAQQYLVPLLKLNGSQNVALISLFIIYTNLIVGTIFTPKIIYKFGTKLSLILGAITYIIYVLCLLTNNHVFIYFSSTLIGFGASLLWVSASQIISESSDDTNLGFNFGFHHSFFLIGSFVSIVIGGLFLKSLPFNILYLIFSISILLSLPFLLLIKSGQMTKAPSLNPISNLFSKKVFHLFPLIFGSYFLSGQGFTALNILVLGLFGLSFVGLFSILGRLVSAISGLSVGKLLDKFDKNKVSNYLIIIGIVGTALLLLTKNVYLISIGIICWSFFTGSTQTVSLSLIKKAVGKEMFINYSTIFFVYSSLGSVIAILSTIYLTPQINLSVGLILLFIAFEIGNYSKNIN